MTELTFSEEYAKHLLEQVGLNVEKIKEGQEKRPDFIANSDRDQYLVEVKEKLPDRQQASERNAVLMGGAVYEDSYVMVRQSLLTKIVSDASQQLSTIDNDAFRIVFFVCSGHNAEARVMQIEATLYGSTTVIDWSEENGRSGVCYYFGHSDFFNYRERIDGAIILNAQTEQAQLFLNTVSPNYHRFKKSALVEAFGTSAIDPLNAERDGLVFVVSSDVDRGDKQAVLAYLRKKYNLGDLTMDMDMKLASAQVLVPDQ